MTKKPKKSDDKHTITFSEDEVCPYIKPGIYKISASGGMFSEFMIHIDEINLMSDEIIDLPSKEYQQTLNQIIDFQKPETRKKYEKYGFLYKRSVLLYGKPGTGKSVLTNRLAKYIVEQSGIVFVCRNPGLIKYVFDSMNHMNKAMFVCVVLEEFYDLLMAEQTFLTLLDGQVQRNNVMYIATTNYIERIPARLLRPGRFPVRIEVKYPDFDCRKFYFMQKTKDEVQSDMLAAKTDGLSIDELKEVAQGYLILNLNLDELVAGMIESRLKAEKEDISREHGHEN